jgi:hypothetical protein
MTPRSVLQTLATAALLALTGPAAAVVQVFDDEASFLAALGNFGTDTFDDLVHFDVYDAPLHRMAGAVGYRATTSARSPHFIGGSDGDDVWLASTNSSVIVFDTFSRPINGVGAYVFGSGWEVDPNVAGVSIIGVKFADGMEIRYERAPSTNNYWGFLSDSKVVQVTVRALYGPRDFVRASVDDLTLALMPGAAMLAPVPEPGAHALWLTGLAALGFVIRRRAPADRPTIEG